jgi:hypothetical protein
VENLEDLAKGFKNAADAAGKLERTQKSLQAKLNDTSNAMGGLSARVSASVAGLTAVEQQVSSLMKAINPLENALSSVSKKLLETATLSRAGVAGMDAYAKAHRDVEAAVKGSSNAEEALSSKRKASAAAATMQSGEVRKLGKSMLDIFMELRKGSSPLDILIEKGPALWEVFSTARAGGVGLQGVLAGVGAELAPLAASLAPLAVPLLAAGAAAATAVGVVAIAAQQIGKSVGENLDHLHLTEEQLARVENKGVTMGDVLSAAWKAVADLLVATFGPALSAVGDFFGNLYQGAVDGVMWLVKTGFQAIGGFVGGMRAAFAGLGPAIADVVFTAVNLAAEGLEKLANGAIGIVNNLMRMANDVAAKLGIPIRLPELDTVSIARLENKYAGAAAALGKSMLKGAAQGAADGGRAYDQMGANIIKSVAAARDRRVVKQAGSASKAANDDDNDVISNVTNNTINNGDRSVSNRNRTTGGQAACACEAVDASVRDFSDVRPIETVQVELLKAQKLGDDVIKAMPQPEALEPFKDALGEAIGHFEHLAKLAPEFGKEFEAAFGKSGKAVGDVIKALADYGAARKKVEQDIEANGDGAEQKRAQVMVEGYGQVAIAAKGFFKEHSTGFAVVEGIERAYHLWKTATTLRDMALDTTSTTTSVANSITRGVASAASGAAKIFEQLGPWGFPVVAAMVGLLASLGLHTGGGGGAAPGANDMKTRQETQGSGSVLGDSKAKSESLEKALTHAQAYENKDLEYGNAMVRSLKSIDDQIGAVAAALARSFGAGGMLSTEGLGLGKAGSSPTLSNLGFSKSTTRTLQDQGIQLDAASLGDIVNGNLSGSTYQQVLENTKKKAFGITTSNKSKVITETGALDVDFLDQVGKLIGSLGKGVADAAKALGATDVEATLAKFKVDLGKLSFKDMTGAQIEEALNAVFSKLGDDMAKAAAPAIAEFQKVGEGAFETLVRVARQYEVIDTTLKSVGMKFGEVGVASLGARERLVELVGGLDNLTDQTAFFGEHFLTEDQRLKPVKDSVTAKLTELKLPTTLSREDFAKAVQGQDLSTEDGAKLYAALMALAPAFDKVATAAEAAKTAVDDRMVSIQDRIDQLTLSSAELTEKQRAKEMEAAKNLGQSVADLLQKQYELEDAQAAQAAAAQAATKAAEEATKAQEAHAAVMQSLGDSIVAAMNRAEELAASLRSLADELLGQMGLGDTFSYGVAKANLVAGAQDGEKLEGLIRAFLDVSKKASSSTSAYQADVAWARGLALAEADRQAARPEALANFWRAINTTGFATGGSFEVGGAGAPDSKLFNLALSPGEMVNVRRPGAANDNGSGGLVAEIRALREEVAELRRTAGSIDRNTSKMESTLTNVTEGGRVMLTEAAS